GPDPAGRSAADVGAVAVCRRGAAGAAPLARRGRSAGGPISDPVPDPRDPHGDHDHLPALEHVLRVPKPYADRRSAAWAEGRATGARRAAVVAARCGCNIHMPYRVIGAVTITTRGTRSLPRAD